MVFIALFGLGIVSLNRVGMELFPDVSLPTVAIVTVSPGVGPLDVEDAITRRIEGAVANLDGIETITAQARESVSIVTVGFTEDTDILAILPDIRERITDVESDFPAGTERSSILRFSVSSLPTMQINVYSRTSGMDVRRLMETEVIPALERIRGVAQVDLSGGNSAAVMVRLDLDAINKLELPISQVLRVFQGENISLPAGTISLEDRQIVVRTVGEFESIGDVGTVLLGANNGIPVFLHDVADISLDFPEQTEFVRTRGFEAVRLSVRKQSGYNTVDVSEAVMEELDDLIPRLPPSLEFEVQNDQAKGVRDSIGGVTDAAWQGGLLAILVLLFFLRNIRSTIIVSITIPVAVIATFSLIDFGGMTLNITSLMGITLAIGMFVDNAIVVLESIYRKQLAGLDPHRAAIEGTEEVSRAIIASTLTTVSVFLPMLFVEGLAGILFQDLSLTISFSLLISLAAALALTPMISARFLKVEQVHVGDHVQSSDDLSLADVTVHSRSRLVNTIAAAIQRVLQRLDEVYERAIRWSIHHAGAIVAGAVVLLGLSVGSVLLLGMEFLPEADEAQFEISMKTRPEATIDHVESRVSRIEAIVRDVAGDDLVALAVRYGAGSSALGSGGSGGTNEGSVYVTLTDLTERERSIWDVVNAVDRRISAEVADIEFSIGIQGMSSLAASISGTDSQIAIELAGDNLSQLSAYADLIASAVRGVPGTRNVRTTYDTGKPELQFRLRRQEAVSLGLSPYEIASTLRAAYNGVTVSRYSAEEDDYDVVVILDPEDRNDLSRINSLFFMSPSGARIPIENVVEMVEGIGPVSISRDNRVRVVRVYGNLTGERALSDVSADIERAVANLGATPAGVDLSYEGSSSEMGSSFNSLFVALLIAVALVYMVMASQFESLLDPLIVMAAVPFAIIGLVAALLVTNTTFSILSFVGAILLVGIVVNNAIVLIDYTNLLRSRGIDLAQAIVQGGKTRLKPILMTSLTTILGMLPMALGYGAGAELRAPIGRAVVGGLVSSTVITVILIPTILWLVEGKLRPAILARRAARRGETADRSADGGSPGDNGRSHGVPTYAEGRSAERSDDGTVGRLGGVEEILSGGSAGGVDEIVFAGSGDREGGRHDAGGSDGHA